MSGDEHQELFRLEGEISEAVYQYFVDSVAYPRLRCDGEQYELEDAEKLDDGSADDRLILVRERDGQRYEVELEVFVRKLPPKPAPPDPDAPVHIEGQEELPLGIGGSA